MRFILTAFLWFILVGGLWLYIYQRDIVRPVAHVPQKVEHLAAGVFSIELTTTFDTEADPFAIDPEYTKSPAIIRVNGQTITLPEVELHRGKVLRLDSVVGVLAGYNEIYVQATPPLLESDLEYGLRLKFFAGEKLLADHTSWSSNGAIISDNVSFIYEGNLGGDSHDHN